MSDAAYFICYLLVLSFLAGCSGRESDTSNSFQEKVVNDVSLISNGENPGQIGAPSELQAVPGGFIIYDYGLKKILKVDAEGNVLSSFGSQGRGPGEYQDFFALWMIDTSYVVYDPGTTKFIRYDEQGNWIEDLPIQFDEFPNFPTKVEPVSFQQFVMPARGKNGSLLMLVDRKTGQADYFGSAVAEQSPMHDPQKTRQAIMAGRIPENMKNQVLLSSNKTGIFSFQETTGLLEKYDFSGKRLWDKHLIIPAVDGLFEHIFKINRKKMKEGGVIELFLYAIDMDANGQGTALLLNNHQIDQPVTVVWIPNDGQNPVVMTFPKIKNQPYQSFTIAPDNSMVFFVSMLDGKVYKASWPV